MVAQDRLLQVQIYTVETSFCLTLVFFDNRIFLTYFAADCFFHVSTIEFPSGFLDTGFI